MHLIHLTEATPRNRVADCALRLVVAAGLVIDAGVHLRLAPGYQLAAPGGIGQGNLFRIEAVVALAVGALVLVRGDRASYLLAAIVGLSALSAVVVTRYVQVPAMGPLPAMYEPVWFFQKSLSAAAEAVAGCLAVVGLVRAARDPRDDEISVDG
jgi:hypothetical protein